MNGDVLGVVVNDDEGVDKTDWARAAGDGSCWTAARSGFWWRGGKEKGAEGRILGGRGRKLGGQMRGYGTGLVVFFFFLILQKKLSALAREAKRQNTNEDDDARAAKKKRAKNEEDEEKEVMWRDAEEGAKWRVWWGCEKTK